MDKISLIDNLIAEGWLKTPRIISAFKEIDRADFLAERLEESAQAIKQAEKLSQLDIALPIGQGQTISQPKVVAFMLELLEPEAGQNILDIGSGSGYTTALLSKIVSFGRQKGKVTALEIKKELKNFGESNVSRYNFINKGIALFLCSDGKKGWKANAPYDRILCSASTVKVPSSWKEQLKDKGIIVAVLGNSIVKIRKAGREFTAEEYPGFIFVPLV